MTQIRAVSSGTSWQPTRRLQAQRPGAAQPHPAPRRVRDALAPRRVRDALASAGIRRPRMLRGERMELPVDAPTLATERLLLRRHSLRDADDWFALESSPAVTEFLPWPERDRRQSDRHLRDRTRHTRLWQQNDFLALAVERHGRVIGDVSLHLREVPAERRSVEIGWVLHPGHSGRGYATEAARALLGFAFEVVGARRVTAVTDARNIRSLALAERLGFTPVRPAGLAEEFAPSTSPSLSLSWSPSMSLSLSLSREEAERHDPVSALRRALHQQR
ncbi:GNAT family N-acetyltransferase [Herbiconiux sp. 11R-BC]|uniref:GNAT family N-acetyltransferase n=1 Tax=Herbiconiux sp. 11R-BC TaxID=3111637 RepID=UPI003C09EC0A